jgi:hypothetical protein
VRLTALPIRPITCTTSPSQLRPPWAPCPWCFRTDLHGCLGSNQRRPLVCANPQRGLPGGDGVPGRLQQYRRHAQWRSRCLLDRHA